VRKENFFKKITQKLLFTGTGKTSSLVECVVQITKLRPEARILITAQSNSACEEIGSRLLKAVPLNKILRIYSTRIDKDKLERMDQTLRSSSNKRRNNDQFPTKQEFKFFTVVIVTLMTSSRLAQSDLPKGHFDYIFLDECAAASEPESLVPVIGLGTKNHDVITASIVILGDHKQLGASVKSDMAEFMGLGISLMERIMTKEQYKAGVHGYNTNYITQLLDNYRCHPAVLQFSNAVFYDNILRARVNDQLRNFAINWELLSNREFPVLFHCVKTPSQVANNSTSSYNKKEIEIVKFYVEYLTKRGIGGKKVIEEDIGIVTPYVAQLRKLRSVVNSIEVGTAEYFQGREKKIIIVSTVKSCTSVGFLKNEKRLNVVLTRAQSLMIVVGNADTLQRDRLWRAFVHYCFLNNAFVGEYFGLVSLVKEDEKLVEQMCAMFKEEKKVDVDEQVQKIALDDFQKQFANFSLNLNKAAVQTFNIKKYCKHFFQKFLINCSI
jgi:helicase MOV-10